MVATRGRLSVIRIHLFKFKEAKMVAPSRQFLAFLVYCVL